MFYFSWGFVDEEERDFFFNLLFMGFIADFEPPTPKLPPPEQLQPQPLTGSVKHTAKTPTVMKLFHRPVVGKLAASWEMRAANKSEAQVKKYGEPHYYNF